MMPVDVCLFHLGRMIDVESSDLDKLQNLLSSELNLGGVRPFES